MRPRACLDPALSSVRLNLWTWIKDTRLKRFYEQCSGAAHCNNLTRGQGVSWFRRQRWRRTLPLLPTANDLMVIHRFMIVLVPNTSVSVKLGFSVHSFVSYLILYSLKVRLWLKVEPINVISFTKLHILEQLFHFKPNTPSSDLTSFGFRKVRIGFLFTKMANWILSICWAEKQLHLISESVENIFFFLHFLGKSAAH